MFKWPSSFSSKTEMVALESDDAVQQVNNSYIFVKGGELFWTDALGTRHSNKN